LISKTLCYVTHNKLECSAALLGIVGGFFFPAVDPTLRVVGAALWVVGNAMWLVFAKWNGKWALFALQFVYMLQNAFAIWNISYGGVI
jgi:hypothetical protein